MWRHGPNETRPWMTRETAVEAHAQTNHQHQHCNVRPTRVSIWDPRTTADDIRLRAAIYYARPPSILLFFSLHHHVLFLLPVL